MTRNQLMYILAIAFLLHSVLCGLIQNPIHITKDEPDNSNLILTSLHALLKSWPQAYAPNGHSVVPGIIKPGTLLYHAGLDPKGLDWFAFDAEHSYIIGGGVKEGSPYNRSHKMYTYAAERALQILHFDGASASKEDGGFLDLQNIIAYGKADGGQRSGDYGDFERGKLLCEWARKYGFEGFVREEATFELLWCDFDVGVQLLSIIDITVPAAANPRVALLDWTTPYFEQGGWSLYHAALWHQSSSESRVILSPAHFVTLYDPVYSSLAANNKLPVLRHNLRDMSSKDKSAFLVEMDQAFTAWNSVRLGDGSDVDWASIAQAVVERNGDRIAEMRKILEDVSVSSNITEVVSQVRLVAFALVMPYIDHASIFSPNVTGDVRITLLEDSAKHCSLAFTGHIDAPLFHLTPQEQRLKRAVEGVLKRICTFSTTVLGSALTLLDTLANDSGGGSLAEAHAAVSTWHVGIEKLMNWLGWAMWHRCAKACEWDELCYVNMWPVRLRESELHLPKASPGDVAKQIAPRCVKMKEVFRY